MARSTRYGSKAVGGADEEGVWQQLTGWCNSDACDPLSLVCALVVVIYIALAHPNNTPVFFGSRVFKFLIFTVVVIVTLMDTKIGVIFGLAMVLSVAYSYIRTNQESFLGTENWDAHPEEGTDVVDSADAPMSGANGGGGEEEQEEMREEEMREEYMGSAPDLQSGHGVSPSPANDNNMSGAAPYHSM